MKNCPTARWWKSAGRRAFTLVEVVMSMGIAVLVCAAIMTTYTMASRRAFFASCSLAANAQAMSYLERAIYAPWKPTIGLNNLLSLSSTNPSKFGDAGAGHQCVHVHEHYDRDPDLGHSTLLCHDPGGLCVEFHGAGHFYQYRRGFARSGFLI